MPKIKTKDESLQSNGNEAKQIISRSLPPMVDPNKNDGWSFDATLIKNIAEKACEIEEGVSMEDVDAVLQVLWRQ